MPTLPHSLAETIVASLPWVASLLALVMVFVWTKSQPFGTKQSNEKNQRTEKSSAKTADADGPKISGDAMC